METDFLNTLENKLTQIAEGAASREELESLRVSFEAFKAEQRRDLPFLGRSWETPGEWLAKQGEELELLRKYGKVTLRLPADRGFFPTERKTTITSTAVGSSTPGILVPERVLDIVPLPERRLTLRDVLPTRPLESGNAVEFPKENAFTNAASPQTEASDKAESALTFTIDSEKVRTLAHWLPVTRQTLDDWPALGRIVDRKLMYGLKLKEEDELLNGSGTGEHLNGLVTQATSYAATYSVANDTKLDILAHAVLEAEDDDETVDFFVLNPKDLHDITLIKDQASNVGKYVVGDPLGAMLMPTIWGLPVVKTNSMSAGSFLVGSSSQAEVHDRMRAEIMISTEHSDFFIKNMVAVRAEERLALAVYRASAFIFGTF